MTVIPDKYQFTIWKGGTFHERLTLYTDSSRTTPRNLTGYTANLKIKPKNSSVVNISGVITAASGIIDFTMSASTTEALTWKGAPYELSITSGSVTDVLLHGTIKVLDSA